MTDDAVEVRDVVVRYGGSIAVDGVSLTVARGRVLALLGNNGAGKTSLLQVCEGFRRADGATTRVLGLDPMDDHDALMPRLGIMLQSGGVYPWATAGEILRLFASFARHPLDVGMLLERLGLRKFERTRFRRLSGGEQQRLAIARALLRDPDVYLFDDSFSALDLATEAQLRAALASRIKSATMIVVAQRVASIRDAQQILVLDSGKLVGKGTHAELVQTCPTYAEIVTSQTEQQERAA